MHQWQDSLQEDEISFVIKLFRLQLTPKTTTTMNPEIKDDKSILILLEYKAYVLKERRTVGKSDRDHHNIVKARKRYLL